MYLFFADIVIPLSCLLFYIISILLSTFLVYIQSNTAKSQDSNKEVKQEQDNSTLDILSFEQKLVKVGSYNTTYTYKVTNNGSASVQYISIDVAYYDASETCVDTSGTYSEIVVSPGNAVNMEVYAGDETTRKSITKAKVTSYYYVLTEPNANGNNKIEVNCETGKIEESYSDNY